MAKVYDPFDKNEITTDGNWFNRAIASVTTLSLATFGYHKMKGPTRDIVSKYFEKQRFKKIERDLVKQQDKQTFEIGPEASIHQGNFGHNFDDNLKNKRLKEIAEIDKQQAKVLARSSERLETTLITRGLSDINRNINKQFISKNKMNSLFVPSDVKIDMDEAEELFFQVRKGSLFEFMATNLGLNDLDRSTLDSMQNEKQHAQTLKTIHENYLYNSREYADIYNRNLKSMYRIYRSEKKVFDAQATSQKYDKDDFKNRMYGNTYFDETPEAAAEQVRLARYVHTPKKINYGEGIKNLKDSLNSGKTFTSGSLDARRITDNKLSRLLGQFDYTPLLKRLANKINELETYRKDKSGISDVAYEIVTKGNTTKKQFFLKLTFKHQRQNKNQYSLEVPLSQHGIIPGSTPAIGERLDGMYLTEEALIKRVSNKYGSTIDLKVNQDLENTSQLMIKHLIDRLDSNIVENEFSTNPNKFISRMRNELNNIYGQAERVEGNLRDEVKKFAILPPKKYSTSNSLEGLTEAISSIKNIRSMKGKKVSIIGIDFETLSRELPGPDKITKDAFTQVSKVGINVSRNTKSGFQMIDADDVISNHGIKILGEVEPISDDVATWLKKDLGSNFNKASNEEVWSAFGKKLKDQAKLYRSRGSGGRKFVDNNDMVRHTAEVLLSKIRRESADGRKVYLLTKNSTFDLHLLERFAGAEWHKIKKLVEFVDVQAIAKFEKVLTGNEDSLALNKITSKIIGGDNPSAYDIDTPGNAQKAFKAIKKKAGLSINKNLNKYILTPRGYWTAAHTEPVADLIFETALFGTQFKRINGDHSNFENITAIENHYLKKNNFDLQKSFLEYSLMEQAWSVEGMLASSSALSHGNIAKKIVSLVGINTLLPIPNNKMGKQWDQLFMGNTVRPTNVKDIKDRVNLADRRITDRYFTPIFMSKGEHILSQQFLKHNDMENYFSHHVQMEGVALWNPWKGKEGYFALSEKALAKHTFVIKKTIDLTDAVTEANTARLSNSTIQVESKIRKKALELANGRQVSKSNWDDAARHVMSELSNGQPGITLPKGTNILSRGDKGFKTIQQEFNGMITNIITTTDINDKIKMQAQVEYHINGAELNSQSFNVRSLVSKATRSQMDVLSQGIAYGGVDAVMNAEFMDKGYIGAMKQVLIEKTINELIKEKANAKSPRDKALAKEKLDRLKTKLHAEQLGVTFMHDPYKSAKFTHITNPNDVKVAQKYFGNIDLSMRELGSHMADAGIVWDLKGAKQWYRSAGGGDINQGRKNMESWINNSLGKANKDLLEQRSNVNGMLTHLTEKEYNNIGEDLNVTLKEWFLPNLDRIEKGAKIPKFFESVRRDNNPDTPFEMGFFHPTQITVYNIMKGRNVNVKNIKFRGNLLQQIDTPYSHVSQYTLDHLKNNRRGYIDKRFGAAMDTYQNFIDGLMGKALTRVKDLNSDDLATLNNRLAGLDLKKVKRWNLNDSKLASIKKDLTEKFLQEYGDKPENHEKAINSILDELQNEKFFEQIEQSNSFVSQQAAINIAKLGEKKKIFSYSKKAGLGGTFDFNIRDLLLNINSISSDEMGQAESQILNAFKILKKSPESIVDDIEFGKNGPIVKLKKILLHADTSPDNVYNVINVKEAEKTHGFLTEPNKYRDRSTKAISKYEEYVSAFQRHEVSKSVVEGSEFHLKKSYLEYMLKGFLLDSSSIYAKSLELAPVGFRASVLGANQIVDSARSLANNIGKSEFSHLKKYEKTLNRIGNASNLTDIFIHGDIADKLQVDGNINLKDHLKNIFGVDAINDSKEIKSILNGESPLYAYSSRNPTIQAGYDAILDKRLNIIPPELAKALGMGVNEAHVFAEHGGLYNMDFDGDQIEFVVKGLDAAKGLAGYQEYHSAQLKQSISRVMESTTSGGIKLKDKLSTPDFVGWNDGKLLANSIDPKTGQLLQHTFEANSKAAHDIMNGGGLFKNAVDNFKQAQLQSFGVLSNRAVKNHMDQLAFVGLSKNMIGLFTNMNMVRSRQLMTVDKLAGDSLLAKSLIGNLNEGPAGLSQMFISMAKHDGDFDKIASAAKASINPLTNDKVAQYNLRKLHEDFYKDSDLGEAHGTKVYNAQKEAFEAFAMAAPNRSEVYNSFKALEKIDLMKDGTNILDALNTLSTEDFIRNNMLPDIPRRSPIADIGDILTKKFKLDTPNARATFRKGGKFAAIGAAAYLAASFFKPNQLSSSINPLDGFTDLGVDIDGSHNAIASSLDLDRGVQLDMVNASFSKKAFIKMNNNKYGSENSEKSSIINDLLAKAFSSSNQSIYDWRTSPNSSYQNYTTNINSLGSKRYDRRY